MVVRISFGFNFTSDDSVDISTKFLLHWQNSKGEIENCHVYKYLLNLQVLARA